MKTIIFALLLTIPLVLTPASADCARVSVTLDDSSYTIVETATGGAPIASIPVTDSGGLGLADIEVRVVFIRQAPLLGFIANETVIVRTDAQGAAQAVAPTVSGLPGSYLVAAFAAGTSGTARYTVGA